MGVPVELPPSRWQLAVASAIGSSHREFGKPCQDAGRIDVVVDALGGVCLIAAVADGAGSAALSEHGAQATCNALVAAVRRWWQDPARGFLDDSVLHFAFDEAHAALELQAQVHDCPLRELACTALLTVVTPTAAGFAQIGDGAIVWQPVGAQAPLQIAFWPEQGEYANVTRFLTDGDWASVLHTRCEPAVVQHLSLFSDGLQRLALKLAEKAPHGPFFAPLWQALAALDPAEQARFAHDMQQWLLSPAIEARTDDDKTLLLAVRVATP
jgi:hypothetical protein